MRLTPTRKTCGPFPATAGPQHQRAGTAGRGIRVQADASVVVERSRIEANGDRGINGCSTGGRLTVSDSVVARNTFGGVGVATSAAGASDVTVANSTVEDNVIGTGVLVGGGTGGAYRVAVTDSVLRGNGSGVDLSANTGETMTGTVGTNQVLGNAGTAVICQGTGTATLKWFRGNFPWLQKAYPAGARVAGSGTVRFFLGRPEIHHPELEVLEAEDEGSALEGVVPVYSEVEGVHPRALRRILRGAVDAAAPALVDLIPPELRAAAGTVPLGQAYREVHFPSKGGPGLEARVEEYRRAMCSTIFFLQLALALTPASRRWSSTSRRSLGTSFRPKKRRKG